MEIFYLEICWILFESLIVLLTMLLRCFYDACVIAQVEAPWETWSKRWIRALDSSSLPKRHTDFHRFRDRPKGTERSERFGTTGSNQTYPDHFFPPKKSYQELAFRLHWYCMIFYIILRYIGHKRLHDISSMGTLGLSVVLASSRSWSTHQMRQMLSSKKLWRTKSRSVPSWSIPVPRCSIQFVFGHLYTFLYILANPCMEKRFILF